MATARDVVQRALRIIEVAAVDEPVTAEIADVGLIALNDMLNGWRAHSVDVGHSTDYTLSSTFETATLTSDYRDAVTHCLAKALASEFGVSLSTEAAMNARDGWTVIQSNFLTSNPLKVDGGMLKLPSRKWGNLRSLGY